jgi:hypothetical protein
MGTAMRFVLGLAGLLAVAIGLGLLGPGIYGVIVAREEFDFPGGVPGIVMLILVAAAVPLLLGGYLLRKAFRSDAAAALVPPGDSTSPAPEPVAPPAARFEPQSTFSASPASIVTPAAAAPEPAAVLTTPEKGPRRTWLAVLGLCVMLPGLLMLLVALAEIATGALPNESSDSVTTVLILLVGAIPMAVGLRIAHAGDRELGRRFVKDLWSAVMTLRDPVSRKKVLRSSVGHATAIALVAVPLMLMWREISPLTGLVATMVFSLVDPVLNFWHRSWWLGAFVSAATWVALFLAIANLAEKLAPMREAGMIFLLPIMAFPVVLGLSGFARFWMWAARRSNPEAFE